MEIINEIGARNALAHDHKSSKYTTLVRLRFCASLIRKRIDFGKMLLLNVRVCVVPEKSTATVNRLFGTQQRGSAHRSILTNNGRVWPWLYVATRCNIDNVTKFFQASQWFGRLNRSTGSSIRNICKSCYEIRMWVQCNDETTTTTTMHLCASGFRTKFKGVLSPIDSIYRYFLSCTQFGKVMILKHDVDPEIQQAAFMSFNFSCRKAHSIRLAFGSVEDLPRSWDVYERVLVLKSRIKANISHSAPHKIGQFYWYIYRNCHGN